MRDTIVRLREAPILLLAEVLSTTPKARQRADGKRLDALCLPALTKHVLRHLLQSHIYVI